MPETGRAPMGVRKRIERAFNNGEQSIFGRQAPLFGLVDDIVKVATAAFHNPVNVAGMSGIPVQLVPNPFIVDIVIQNKS